MALLQYGKNRFPPTRPLVVYNPITGVYQSTRASPLDQYSTTPTYQLPPDYFQFQPRPPPLTTTPQIPATDVQVAVPTVPPGAPGASGRTVYSGPDVPSKERWKWWTTVWTAVSLLLCPACIYCTLPAVVCNIFAYVDHKNGDYDRKNSKLQCAIAWSVGAFVAGSIATIILLIVLFTRLDAQHWNPLPAPPDYDY